MTWSWFIAPALLAGLIATAYFWGPIRQLGLRASLGPSVTPASAPTAVPIQIIADNLTIPWELVWLPDSSMLITQRPGTVLKISPDGQRTPIPFPAPVTQVSESGLLGLTLHPNFSQNQLVYFYFTTGEGSTLRNRVVRYQLINNSLGSETIILDNIPAGNFHDGGRIKFGPDGWLYVATGDAGNEKNAQDLNSLAGKILRIGDGGGLPEDNPSPNSPVYSSGHRNVQGLAWDSAGNLWATEHGRSGVQSGLDELNLIKPGQNYGWPTIQGDETKAGLISPIIQSGASETWAPSGMAFLPATSPASVSEADSPGVGAGSLFFAGLRGETLYEAKLNGERVVELKRHFSKEFGRLRDVVVGPDNALYLLTNNTDGRGNPKPGDDKIIRVEPASLFPQ